MPKLPVLDAHGGSLVSLVRHDGAKLEDLDGSPPLVRSLVVVEWGQQVLLGFNVGRQQWELPGGAVEPGESAQDAAIRELAEETGINTDRVALVALAEFIFEAEATRHLAAVIVAVLGGAPELIENDEMNSFVWWDPKGKLCDGMSPLDAEVARYCFPLGDDDRYG
jgi:8-oxo-dGTP diphosphatase